VFQINTLNTYLRQVKLLTQLNSYMLAWIFYRGNHNVAEKIVNGNLKIIIWQPFNENLGTHYSSQQIVECHLGLPHSN